MLRVGEVAWYVTGRFYVAEDGSIRDGGRFLHLQGVEAPLTFLSAPFHSHDHENGTLKIGIDTVGSFSIHLNEDWTYDDPLSFGRGECVATFERVSMVVGTQVGTAVTLNTFSARLTNSSRFTFDGRHYDIGKLFRHGVTQWGTASPDPITPPPKGFTTVVPFVGSAVAF